MVLIETFFLIYEIYLILIKKGKNVMPVLLSYFFLIQFLLVIGLNAQNNISKNNQIKDLKEEIIFGQSAILSGPLELYGSIIKNAINTCFQRINDEGGINNKKLRLVSLDDQGDPLKAEKNIDNLKNKGITMFLGSMGTRSILKALPRIKSQEIAMFFPWAGDEQFRSAQVSNLINGPGFLYPQVKSIADHIINNVKHKKIAIFHADDDFSTQAASDFTKILQESAIQPIITASYNRFTLDIFKQADKILDTDPKIVVCISATMPAVRLINRFFKKGHYATLFFGIDSTLFVSSILKNKGVNFSYTSPVPDPVINDMPIAKQYIHDFKKYTPKEIPNILSFTYYISAMIIVEAIKKIDGEVSQKKIIENIEKMNGYDIGGFVVDFDLKTRHAFGNYISLIKG